MVTNSKLSNTTATVSDVLSGKTFYSGNKTIKAGTITSKDAETVTLDANTTSKTFATSGKYCTGDMSIVTNTKSAENKTITPSGSAQSYTFSTKNKLCTGDMIVTVNAAPEKTITLRLGIGCKSGYWDDGNFHKWNAGWVKMSVDGGSETQVVSVAADNGNETTNSGSITI